MRNVIQKNTLLLIEDERPLVEAIELKLKKYNFDIVTARTCEQAIGYLDDVKKIDAVWLDHYLLGEATGLDFIEEVKNKAKWKRIPIFVVSNTGSSSKRRVYLRLGAVKYYVKSDHRLEAIVKDIEKYLNGKSRD
jgi:DNA-binding response OmpR family regulator